MDMERINRIDEKIVDIKTILETYSILLKYMSDDAMPCANGFLFLFRINIEYMINELIYVQDNLEENIRGIQ